MPYPLPPWLQPQNFVGAMQAGGALGAQIRSQDIQRAEAADRLRLAEDQMMRQSEQFAAQQAGNREERAQAAAQALRQQQALGEHRAAQLGLQERGLDLKERDIDFEKTREQRYVDQEKRKQQAEERADAKWKAAQAAAATKLPEADLKQLNESKATLKERLKDNKITIDEYEQESNALMDFYYPQSRRPGKIPLPPDSAFGGALFGPDLVMPPMPRGELGLPSVTTLPPASSLAPSLQPRRVKIGNYDVIVTP